MSKYCAKCGEENLDDAKFCMKCGNPFKEINTTNTINNGSLCPKCNKSIPIGINKCPYCGNVLIEENHTTAIVIGYIFTILALFIGFTVFPAIIGIVMGIYLLTRENKNVHKHGVIMIVLIVLLTIINIILAVSYANYLYRTSYYYNYPYYYYY